MKRQENQITFPTVPLFNQKKRSRVPLTSAPPANESYNVSFNEYINNSSTAAPPSYNKAPGSFGFYQPPKTEMTVQQERSVYQALQPQNQFRGNRPAPRAAPAMKQYAPLPHPYKAGNTSLKVEQTNPSVRQIDSEAGFNSTFNKYQPSRNSRNGQGSHPGPSQMCQQPSYKPPKAAYQFSQQSVHQPPPAQVPTRPTSHTGQQQSKAWNFTNTFGPQPTMLERKKGTKPSTPNVQVKTPPTFQIKPANGTSLRILTAVIDGMRHWNQFRDKVPHLFELFATLDSAVTLGPYGAKNFLIRDGKEVVQCVYYENETELPRLIRGQVHRCVGNYDRSKNVLVCVSIRPALPSELRNAQEAVRVCDAEMRALVKTLSEV